MKYNCSEHFFLWMLFLCVFTYGQTHELRAAITMPSSVIQYSLNRNNCPLETSKQLVNILTQSFEQHLSAVELKREFYAEHYDQRYFIKNFQFTYDPFFKKLHLTWDCYHPLLRLDLYEEGQKKLVLSSLLSKELTLIDPNMENILLREKLIKRSLPYFSLDRPSYEANRHLKVVDFINRMDANFFDLVAEFILGKNDELTVVLRKSALKVNDPHQSAPTYFLGDQLWDEKLSKMLLIHNYFNQRKKYPSMVNLLSMKKVIVKF